MTILREAPCPALANASIVETMEKRPVTMADRFTFSELMI